VTEPHAPAIVELDGVARTYPGSPPVPALHPTRLRVEPGDYVTIVGPSGSGKSTLLNVLGLLDSPTGGRYLIDGVDTGLLGESQRTAVRGQWIGFVFQSFHLLPYRTAAENVALAGLYAARPRRERDAAAAACLDQVGLAHRRHALPSTMSGGECQRVAIARALAHSPRLLLCDEPTGALDSENTTNLLELFDDLHDAGITIITITHDAEVAARGQRRIAIRDGHVTERDPAHA